MKRSVVETKGFLDRRQRNVGHAQISNVDEKCTAPRASKPAAECEHRDWVENLYTMNNVANVAALLRLLSAIFALPKKPVVVE